MIALVSVTNSVRAMGSSVLRSPALPSRPSRAKAPAVDYAWCGEEERRWKDGGREDRSTARMGEGMTKERAGCRCDVQRQMRAAAVDLAVSRDRRMAYSVRRLAGTAGLVRPVDRRHGSLGAPGVI